MPCRYQPKSLLSLSESRVVSNVVYTCYEIQELVYSAQTFLFVKNQMRQFWQLSVPVVIRRRILIKCMNMLADVTREGHSISPIDTVPLCLLAVMLDKDIVELKVQLCCYYGCSHQNAMLRLLASEAKGLEKFELSRSTLLRLDTQLFHSALLSMSNLKCLILKNIACDKLLKIIGLSCFVLEKLDISNSSQVTDEGLKNLLLQIEIRDKQKLDKYSIESKGQTITKISLMKILRTLSRKLKTKISGEKVKIDDMSFILEYCQKSTQLCSTMRVLNMANTSITSLGILLALKNIPNLENLGEYCHIGKALELLDKLTEAKQLQLTMINACRTTSARLQTLCDSCTRLNRLTISEPLHTPNMLSYLPHTLIKINLQSVPVEQSWVSELYNYFSGSASKKLREVFLKFRRNNSSPLIDLSKILPALSDLEVLSIDNAEIQWIESPPIGNQQIPPFKKLQKLQLCNIRDVNTFRVLLRRTPFLKVLHIYSINTESQSSLIEMLNEHDDLTKNLDCLYFNELLPSGNPDTLKELVTTCPKINKIGNVANWSGVNRDEIKDLNEWIQHNNYKLELCAGSHWYCSECFPIA
ncbi:uncharacterized protein LOC126897592 [Daktulosphaira vitifoliae]|uniref:uncharacterized protein LOC126897592 n=1 Tax=Daktulosphaira vitifoliae TaxID=58002 RepID=UPI0021AAC05C|nr:uncharacterized protein LOC126897592 [Daktulosphaira vitifoliae]